MFWHLGLVNFTSDVASQPEMLCNHTDDVLSTDREYVMQLFEHSSIRMDEVVDNHCSDFRQPEITLKMKKFINSLTFGTFAG